MKYILHLHLASLGILALARIAAGAPAKSATATNGKQCVQVQVPVSVVATNYHYTMPRVDSNIDAIDWTVNVTTWSTPSATERITGPVPVNRTFSINAQLCVPSQKGKKANILQIATQGLGFDKRYWDVEIRPEEYSYVDAAIKKGYSVLTYDRLGTGKSEKPDAYDIVQIPTEVEILAGLTRLARNGKLISSSKILSATSSAIVDFQPSKVVHVGHSFGSFLIAIMLPLYGNLSDGAILTGLLFNTQLGKIDVLHYDHEFARQHDPVRFGEYPSGYIVLSTESCLQKLFFRKGTFDPKLLTYTDKIKQPETVGEYASETKANSLIVPALDFRGPIQFFIGEYDNFVCDGDCRNTYMKDYTESLYPAASHIYPYLQPNTGHALTVATNASAGYQVMLQYLDSRGL